MIVLNKDCRLVAFVYQGTSAHLDATLSFKPYYSLGSMC